MCVCVVCGSNALSSYCLASHRGYVRNPSFQPLFIELRPFLKPAYDEKTRTFTADVVWFPARADGERMWRYRMVFSEDLEYIESGTCISYRDASEEEEEEEEDKEHNNNN